MLMPFTSDVIMLAIGFAVGYWLLTTAARYETRLNKIGETLAWVLIASTLFLTVCNLLFSLSSMNSKHYIPVNSPNGSGDGQTVINEREPQAPMGSGPGASPGPAAPPGPEGQPGGMQQPTSTGPVGGGHPIKNTGSGPFSSP